MTSSISGPSGLDPAMLRQMREQLFAKLDADQDGGIAKAEIEEAAKAKDKEAHGAKRLERDFDKLDADGDGKISQAEMESAFEKMDQKMKGVLIAQQDGGRPPPPPGDQDLMSAFDANGDGTLDQSELAGLAAGGGAAKGLAELFQSFDSDGDGNVTGDEAKAGFESIIDKLREQSRKGFADALGAGDGAETGEASALAGGVPPDPRNVLQGLLDYLRGARDGGGRAA